MIETWTAAVRVAYFVESTGTHPAMRDPAIGPAILETLLMEPAQNICSEHESVRIYQFNQPKRRVCKFDVLFAYHIFFPA